MDPVTVIGAPSDFGGNRRGVNMGPSAIRYAGLVDEIEVVRPCTDDGDVTIPPFRGQEDEPVPFLDETRQVAEALTDEVSTALEKGTLPVVLGGDHSIAIGTVRGAAQEADIGVLWCDAHGDVNTPETSPSGNIHGMPLAALLGHGTFADASWAHAGIREEDVVYVGLRDLDEEESRLIRESEMTAFTMHDIDVRGLSSVMEEALDIVTAGTDGVHVSLDMDWLDPSEAPGVGTPVHGGVTYREAHLAMEMVAEQDILQSLEVVEVNPVLDERNTTAELAAELVASALGRRIL